MTHPIPCWRVAGHRFLARTVTALACATLALLPASCKQQPMEPSELRALFVRWFVNPSPATLDTLLANVKTCEQIQSLLAMVTGNPDQQAGALSVVLHDSANVPYTVGYLTPKTIRRDTLYPLIVYLHGGTGTTVTNKGEKAYEMLAPLADTFQLFLASPSANRTTPWWSPVGLSRIMQTVRFMSVHYPIDPSRVFLAGVSDGATGCYAVANTLCGPFAGFFAVSGFGGMLEQYGMQLVPGNMMQRPIYNINAGKDHLYPANVIARFLDALTAQGVNIIRKTYPKESHGFDYRDKEYGALAGYIRTWTRPDTLNGFVWTMVHGFPNAPDCLLEIRQSVRPIGSPFVSGFWRGDTLIVQAQGAGRFVISHGERGAPNPPHVVINGGAAERMELIADDREWLFRSMLLRASPTIPCRATYAAVVPED